MESSSRNQPIEAVPEYLEDRGDPDVPSEAPKTGLLRIEQTYRVAGREAQHAFWAQGKIVAQSMLHQLALQVAR